ncbi:MAG: PRC-barrel domain-containing protein [Anaerolineales bacterium]|nr:PRC-barrel domain-containing protein [Anaerolineales bacterium]MCA9928497.1 PRC-barrel domain-containing protein [Anaerolineales bacterium]
MRLGKELTGKQIISISDGRLLGSVKDIYLDEDLRGMTGIYTGSEGLIKRKALLIHRESVVVFGIDAVLVKNAGVVTDSETMTESEHWVRLSKLRGRDIETHGGTKVGTVGDIAIGEEGNVIGFSLARVFVEGPVAEKGYIPRTALFDTGSIDGVMTIDLTKAESQTAVETPEPVESSDEE